MRTERPLPTGTVTLLLADVEASTPLWEADTDTAARVFVRLESLSDEAVAQHGGARPIEMGEGDSFVAGFVTASEALACALDLQLALTREPWPGEAPVRVRMALHSGEVLTPEEGRYAGPTVNRCARLRSLAHGGQILISEATRDLVGDALSEGVVLRDLGLYRLRGLERPERAFQLCHAQLPADFPALAAPEAEPNLPAQVTSFLGRESELDQIGELLTRTRLLTLTGAGGVGKTRLAVAAAAATRDLFPDGTSWIELAPIADPALIAHVVASEVGCREQAGEDVSRTLARHLRHRRALLVLDNCEHVVGVCAELVGTLLRRCPSLCVVATSREALAVEGETCLRVPSLGVPPPGLERGLEGFAAVRLFVDRARQVQPDFGLEAETAAAVASICRRLDGIPLAIELAAARVRLLSASQIDEALADRFHLLTGGTRGGVARQRTLEASVQWSYRLLEDRERTLLERLSVFAGGFDLRAAEEVCAGGALARGAILDLLAGLVDKSLVQAEADRTPARYRLLETIRVYALAKLADRDDAAAVRTRHLDHFVALAEHAQPELRGAGLDDAVRRLETDLDNLRAALIWALSSRQVDKHLRAMTSLSVFWTARNMFAEARGHLEAALEAPDTDPGLRARASGLAAVVTIMAGSHRPARVFAERAVVLAREAGDRAALTFGLQMLGWMRFWLGDHGLSEVAASLELAEQDGDTMSLNRTLMYRGVLESNLNGPAHGRPYFERCAANAERDGDMYWLSMCKHFAGQALFQQGDLALARSADSEGLAASRALRFDTFSVFNLSELAKCAIFSGRLDDAAALLHEAELLAREAGPIARAVTMTYRSLHLLAIGDARGARTSIEAALAEWQQQGNLWHTCYLQILRCRTALLSGDVPSARALADDAIGVARPASFRWHLGLALHARARVAIAESEWHDAEDLAHEALQTMVASDDRIGVADVLETLTAIAVGMGTHLEAARLCGAAARLRDEIGAVRLPIDDAAHIAVVDAARSAVGERAYDEAQAAGRDLSVGEAVAYATRGRGERRRPAAGWDSLTPAEVEVVRAVASGLSNPEIAAKLFVSRNTVKTHLRHVFAKLDVGSRAELAAAATRRGL